ncbi:MAG: VTT domain-containing protein [Bifidobacteriaceae bacterium]|nr:VTT domain-containing protein [Bifidobacteriaceae bacterium]
MVDWVLSKPFAVAFVFLTAVACVRSQCTYWLGRGVRAGLVRSAWAKRLTSEGADKARDRLERWGWPAIPVSFLTIGFQTAVNLSAGLIGWRWWRYTLAAVPGWIMWGSVYATGGLALFAGLASIAQESPVLGAAIVQAVVVVVLTIVAWVRYRASRRAKPPAPTQAAAEPKTQAAAPPPAPSAAEPTR